MCTREDGERTPSVGAVCAQKIPIGQVASELNNIFLNNTVCVCVSCVIIRMYDNLTVRVYENNNYRNKI